MSKKFDCVEMKLKIQKDLYKKTEKMSDKDAVKYLEEIAYNGKFAHLFKKSTKNAKKNAA